jgi:hypothetical protein
MVDKSTLREDRRAIRQFAEELQRKKQLDISSKLQDGWYNSDCEPIADRRCKLYVGGMVSE